MLSTASIWLIHGFMVLMVSNHHTLKIKTLSQNGADIFSKTGACINVHYIENTLSLRQWRGVINCVHLADSWFHGPHGLKSSYSENQDPWDDAGRIRDYVYVLEMRQ